MMCEERKFVPAEGLRQGHSDLRLDRGFKQPHYGLGNGNHHQSKEIARETKAVETAETQDYHLPLKTLKKIMHSKKRKPPKDAKFFEIAKIFL